MSLEANISCGLIVRKCESNINTVYQDITVFDNKISHNGNYSLVFNNYYVYTILIQQFSSANSNLITILDNKILMPNAHEEKGSQDFYCIKFSEFSSSFVNKGQYVLRINFIQPSPLWKTYELRNIKVLITVPKSTILDSISLTQLIPLNSVIEKDINYIKNNKVVNLRIGGLEVIPGESIRRITTTKKKKKKNNNITKVSSNDVDITHVDDAIYIP